MTKQEVEQIAEAAIAKAVSGEQQSTAQESQRGAGIVEKAKGKESTTPAEITAESVEKMVEAAIAKALEPQQEEPITAEQVEEMITAAVEKAIDPVLKSRGLPRSIIRKAAVETTSLSSGLLNPEQSRKFIQQTFEATNLNKLVRHEMRTAKTGEIDKIGIASRILRKKTENTDDGYRAGVETSQIEYSTTAVRLPWEITEETLRENIEGQSLEKGIADLMTARLGTDLEDLYLNGDEDAETTDPAHDFLYINDGWIKQISKGGHVYDASSESSMSLDLFYKTLKTLPNKYNNGKLRWLMAPHRAQEWELFLLNKVVNAGGAVPESVYNSPARIPTVECPSLDDSTIILTDPKNLIVVNTYDMKIRKTTEGKEAIRVDKRFYVVHLDFDPVIEELDAAAIIKGLK